MPGKPLPDHPDLLRALFVEVSDFLSRADPYIRKGHQYRAEMRAVETQGETTPQQAVYLATLKEGMRQDWANMGSNLELIYDYMTCEEYNAIGESLETMGQVHAARALAPPAVFSKVVRWRPEDAFPMNHEKPLRRLYREVREKMERLADPPRPSIPPCSVELSDEAHRVVLVFGRPAQLTDRQWDVVRAMVAAYPARLGRKDLAAKSNGPRPDEVLETLRTSGELRSFWQRAILLPGKTRLGYGLAPREAPDSMRNESGMKA